MSSTKQQLADAFSLMAKGLETGAFAEAFPVGLTVPGSEHGEAEPARRYDNRKGSNARLRQRDVHRVHYRRFRCRPV